MKSKWIWTLLFIAMAARVGSATESTACKNRMPYYVLEALDLSERLGDRLWPGFHLKNIPIAIYVPGGEAYLVNHPKPPSGFLHVDLPSRPAICVHRIDQTDMFDAATSAPINGILTAVVPFVLPGKNGQQSPVETIGLIFHEAFHVFQDSLPFPSINFAMFSTYPETDVDNNALARLEGGLLSEALSEHFLAGARLRLRDFLAVRASRQKKLGESLSAYENATELFEGMAQYIEIRSILAAYEIGRTPIPELRQSEPAFTDYRDAESKREGLLHDLAQANGKGRYAHRRRFYLTGMAQCWALDRIDPGWKTTFGSHLALLSELLADCLIPEKSKIKRLVSRIAQHDEKRLAIAQRSRKYDSILAEETAASSALIEGKRQRLAAFLEQPGKKLVVDVANLGWMGNTYFDPMNIEMMADQVKLHSRRLQVTYIDLSISLDFQQPVAEDRAGNRFVTVIREGELTIECDGKKVNPDQDRETQFTHSLYISAPGLKIKATSGILSIRGNSIGIRFQPQSTD